jgi:hypothetical protein
MQPQANGLGLVCSSGAVGIPVQFRLHEPVGHTKALWPVIDLPTIRVFISRVPSKE